MDFMDFSRRLYRWASEGVDMYVMGTSVFKIPMFHVTFVVVSHSFKLHALQFFCLIVLSSI